MIIKTCYYCGYPSSRGKCHGCGRTDWNVPRVVAVVFSLVAVLVWLWSKAG